MKYLAIGDIHIKPDNVDEIEILFADIRRICAIEHPDYIVLLGDILHYHEKILTPCLNRALAFIKCCKEIAFTYVLVGNHDYTNNSSFLGDNHWMNALKTLPGITIVDKVVVDPNNIVLLPYVYPGRFVEALQTISINFDWTQQASVIFAHQEFLGCKMGSIESKEGDVWNEDWPLVISGHIHDNQTVGGNIYYPGSPLQHSFGDPDKRVVCLVTIEQNNQPTYRDIFLNVPKKKVINTSIQDIGKMKIPTGISLNNGDKLKVKVDATTEEFKMFKESKEYKKMIDLGIKFQHQKTHVEFKDIQTERKHCNFREILELLMEADHSVKNIFEELMT